MAWQKYMGGDDGNTPVWVDSETGATTLRNPNPTIYADPSQGTSLNGDRLFTDGMGQNYYQRGGQFYDDGGTVINPTVANMASAQPNPQARIQVDPKTGQASWVGHQGSTLGTYDANGVYTPTGTYGSSDDGFGPFGLGSLIIPAAMAAITGGASGALGAGGLDGAMAMQDEAILPGLTTGGSSSVGASGALTTGGAAASGGGMDWFDPSNFDPTNFSGGTTNDFFDPNATGALTSSPASTGGMDLGGGLSVDASGNITGGVSTIDGPGTNFGALGGNIDPSTGLPMGTDPSITSMVQKYGQQGLSLIQKALTGDPSSISALGKLGIGAAALAALGAKTRSPLVGTATQASQGALNEAGTYASLPSVPLTASGERAITTANANVGDWQPATNEAAALTTSGTGGVSADTISKYLNPYLQGVLTPQLTQIDRDTANQKMQQQATAAMHGAFGGDQSDIQSGIIDRNATEAKAAATGNTYAAGYNTALGAGQQDLNRDLTGASSDINLGKTIGALGTGDVANLAGAGALEQSPIANALDKTATASKLFAGAVPSNGTIQATGSPNVPLQVAGALGALTQTK